MDHLSIQHIRKLRKHRNICPQVKDNYIKEVLIHKMQGSTGKMLNLYLVHGIKHATSQKTITWKDGKTNQQALDVAIFPALKKG